MGYIIPPPPRNRKRQQASRAKPVSHKPTYSGGEEFATWKVILFFIGLALLLGTAYFAFVYTILPDIVG